jgi:hypothetical protein
VSEGSIREALKFHTTAMNSIEILYQIYRARYSLNRVQDALDKGFKLAVVGAEEQQQSITNWLGELRDGASDK